VPLLWLSKPTASFRLLWVGNGQSAKREGGRRSQNLEQEALFEARPSYCRRTATPTDPFSQAGLNIKPTTCYAA
jgi:hypothetical protein